MTRERLDLGNLGERLALEKIKGLGYRCIEKNYRCALGEIDLIAKDRDCLVFIEIKTRKGRSIGYAKEAVTQKKIRQISKVALAYMKANNCCDTKARFDVVAVNIKGEREEIEVIKDAFELAY
ncbi:MAG: YraN family protein [Deltaproteobacteria bacterium]|nr:YraN family protein [Deltaproteobacteria bacterium]